jgi:hypothetical protein
MKASENGRREAHIPPYSCRKYFPRKIREIEKKIRALKNENNWIEASKLEYTLRNSWWGYKRYY